MSVIAVDKLSIDSIISPMGSIESWGGGELVFFLTASSLVSNSVAVSIKGKDYPVNGIDFLNSKNVNTDFIIAEDNVFNGRRKITYNKKDIYTPETVEYEEHDPKLYNIIIDNFPVDFLKDNEPSILYIGDYEPEFQLTLIDKVKDTKTMTVVNSSLEYWNDSKTKSSFNKLLKNISVLFLKEEDIINTYGNNITNLLAEIFPKKGLEYIVIYGNTRCILWSKNRHFSATQYLLENTVDITGTYETFMGAFLSYLDTIKSLEQVHYDNALVYAVVVSSFCAEGLGVNGYYNINLNRIIDRFEEYKTYTAIPDIMGELIELKNIK